MTDYTPGNIVDIEIKGAKVVVGHGEDTGFHYGAGTTWLDLNAPPSPSPRTPEVPR